MRRRLQSCLPLILFLLIWLPGCRSKPSVPLTPSEQQGHTAVASSETVPSEQQILQRRLAAARAYFQEGRYEISREMLREIDDPANPEIQLLQARIALAQGDSALAGFYLKKTVEGAAGRLEPEQEREAYQLLAGLSYGSGDLDNAYRYYLRAVNRSDGPPAAEVWIRLAEIAFFRRSDAEAARVFLANVRGAQAPKPLHPENSQLLQRLSRRLSWSTLSPEQFGLNDANISALRVDGDDLWIGTWNGGISRYSIGRKESTVFQMGSESLVPRTVRSIEITPTRVWIGTYQGLYQYTKSSSRWQQVRFFDDKVEALRAVGKTLYVGTLGRGLWRTDGEGWEKLYREGLPGEFINCLTTVDDHLLIGTLNLGLIMLEMKTGKIFSFDSINPNLKARNVITLLPADEDTLWIGTYGEGLYRWKRSENSIEHFSRASGQLADDWVLCAVRAESGLYFGTFGGGVSHLSPNERSWRRIGLSQGLAALDISTATYAAPNLFFGTLGSGISILNESLVAEGAGGIE